MNIPESRTEEPMAQDRPGGASVTSDSVSGVLSSLKVYLALLSSLVREGVQTRWSLFELEWAEWKGIFLRKVITGFLLLNVFFLLMISFNIFIVVYFWDTHRVQAALGVVLFFLFTLSVLGVYGMRIGSRFVPFDETLRQLKKDMGKE